MTSPSISHRQDDLHRTPTPNQKTPPRPLGGVLGPAVAVGNSTRWPKVRDVNPTPAGDDWAEGTGIAMAMLDSGPPTEHRSGAQMTLLPDGRKPPRFLPWVSASITRAGIW
jgi:hypothetical protein